LAIIADIGESEDAMHGFVDKKFVLEVETLVKLLLFYFLLNNHKCSR